MLSYKKVGIILSILLIVIALVWFYLANQGTTPKRVNTVASKTTYVSTSSTRRIVNTSSPTKTNVITTTKVFSDQDDSMLELGDTSKLDYSGVSYKSRGTVVGKRCFEQNNQVIYRLDISLESSASINKVVYYCAYSVYSSINLNDSVSVEYKQVLPSVISVVSVSR